MTDFEKFANKVFNAIYDIEPENEKENTMRLIVLMYIYHSLENEEVFNTNCEILNKTRKR